MQDLVLNQALAYTVYGLDLRSVTWGCWGLLATGPASQLPINNPNSRANNSVLHCLDTEQVASLCQAPHLFLWKPVLVSMALPRASSRAILDTVSSEWALLQARYSRSRFRPSHIEHPQDQRRRSWKAQPSSQTSTCPPRFSISRQLNDRVLLRPRYYPGRDLAPAVLGHRARRGCSCRLSLWIRRHFLSALDQLPEYPLRRFHQRLQGSLIEPACGR